MGINSKQVNFRSWNVGFKINQQEAGHPVEQTGFNPYCISETHPDCAEVICMLLLIARTPRERLMFL